MKELIYRRTTAGYKIDKCAEGIPAANRQLASAHATSNMEISEDALCYRQFRLEDGTMALGIGYMDPHGSRNSVIGHVLCVGADEIGAILDSYPSASRYFSRFRAGYSEDPDHLQNKADMEIPVGTYLEGCSGGMQAAADLLKRYFHTQESLAALFEALLDAASDNARMVVIFGEAANGEKMAEEGRSLIEALFAWLPAVIARRLGYISPSNNDAGNAMFGVRYSAPRAIDTKMRNYVYTFDLASQTLNAPPKPAHEAAAYAAILAQFVFGGANMKPEIVKRINGILDDEGLYGAANVPDELALRFRFYQSRGAVSPEDMKRLVKWHHQVIEEADKKKDGSLVTHSKFWIEVDRWILHTVAKDVYARVADWKKEDPVYSGKFMAELYADGQKLFMLQRPEAKAYAGLFENRLKEHTLLDAASEKNVADKLRETFCHQIKNSKDSEMAKRCLYWKTIEEWMRGQWVQGAAIRDRAVCEAVRSLYSLSAAAAEEYVSAYVQYCGNESTVDILDLNRSEFGREVFRRLAEQDEGKLIASMEKKPGQLSLFGESVPPETVEAYITCRQILKPYDALSRHFQQICRSKLENTLKNAAMEKLDWLFSEIERSEEQDGMIRTGKLMDPDWNVHREIQNAIVRIGQAKFYDLYDRDERLAQKTARLLDEAGGRGMWSQRLDSLKKIKTLRLATLQEDAFHSLMKDGFQTGGERQLQEQLKKQFKANIDSTFTRDNMDYQQLIMALALYTGNGGGFSPRAMLRYAEDMGVDEKKLTAACRKLRRSVDTEGVGYIAEVLLSRPDSDFAEYPGTEEEYEKDETSAKAPPAWLGALLTGAGGFLSVAGVLGILYCIGLF